MRLSRLDLTRYGIFTDHSVDFGERVGGTPDLHIIYGPNEAGKSTLFAAWLDLLYGIEMRSPYGFLHPYPTMRISGALEFSDSVREFVRIKKPQNSLLDVHEQPIAESAILGEFGGIDREAYRTMFSLDDDTLKQGGESILKAKGELGQLLFSGSSGLADLSRKIEEFHSEADGFYKFHARSGQLHDLKNELDQLKQEKDQFDTQASKHAELAETVKRTKALYDETSRSRSKLQVRKDEIQRLLNARPRLAKLRSLREQISPLEAIPDAPMGWAEELPALHEQEIKLVTQTQSNADEVKRLETALEAITVDDAALRLTDKLEDIAPLRARHMTAEKDLPDRRQKLRDLDTTISLHLHQVEQGGETNPARLILPASTVARLRELIESHSGIDAKLSTAREELFEAKERLNEATAKLGDGAQTGNTGNETYVTTLKEALAALRASDHAARQRLAERASQDAQAKLVDCLATLTPWRGEADQLVAMSVPGADALQRWKTTGQAIEKRIDQRSGEIERLRTEEARLTTEQDAVSSVTGIVTDQDAAQIRAERDHAWAEHRNRLDASSAERFEDALHRDDGIVARRFGHVKELAQLHETAKALKLVQSDLARAEELHAKALADAQELMGQIAEAISALSPDLPSDWTLQHLEAWLICREKALEARGELRTATRDLQAAQNDADAIRERLTAALSALKLSFAPDAEEAALAAMAQTALDHEAELKRLRTAWEERGRDVSTRERAFEQAESEILAWDTDWKQICAGCWLGERGAAPVIAEVRSILTVIAELASALKEKTTLADRIAKMEEDQAAFRDAVTALASELVIAAPEATAVMDLVREIDERIRKAEADRTEKAKETPRLETAQATARKLTADKLALDRRKQEMTEYFGVSTLAEVSATLDRIAIREDLSGQAAEEIQEILDALRLTSFEAAESALDRLDQTALETELAEITTQAGVKEEEWRDSYAAYRDAEKQIEAIGGDAKVAEIEEQRRTVLLEIEEGVRRYMRLRAGTIATEQALHLYREQHRSSMMARASEALRTISRGRYISLTTQPDKDSEVLVAIGSDKGSKLATEMSRGTRFQLYLALRVAGYFEFAKTRNAVPFIADDIMETFDDFRAEEAFRLFAEMAATGQVIYLTHHQHLCEIARQVCPTVKVHNLPEEAVHERQIKGHVDGVELGGKHHGRVLEMDLNRTH